MSDPRQLSFWMDEENELWNDLDELIIVSLTEGVKDGIEQLPPRFRALLDWNKVNKQVLNYAKEYRYSLIKGITDTTRQQTQQAISDWMMEGSPLDALTTRLDVIYNNPVRAQMIATTEVTRLFAEGNRQAWESTGFINQMVWQTAEDDRVCPICSPRSGSKISVADHDAIPPAHVNCRCWLKPIVDTEAVADQRRKRLGL